MACGQDVKLSEIHGMAQRGGAVTTVVRLGDSVASMVADKGSVDYLVSFEKVEALRNIEFLKDGGALLVNDEFIAAACRYGCRAGSERRCRIARAGGAVLVPAEAFGERGGQREGCERRAFWARFPRSSATTRLPGFPLSNRVFPLSSRT